MPAISFRPAITFDWTKPAKRPPVRTCAPRRKAAKKKPTLALGVRTVLIDRLEEAIRAGRIDFIEDWEPTEQVQVTTGEIVLLLQILFPEEWPEVVKTFSATRTAPGSAERIAIYAERESRGEELYHPIDACPVRGDGCDGRLVAAGKLALLVAQRGNGSGPKVLGWAG